MTLTPDGLPVRERRRAALVIILGILMTALDGNVVTLALPNGAQQTFRRDGEIPRVVINDPMQAHKQLLPKYRDEDIHNLTAYLVTVK